MRTNDLVYLEMFPDDGKILTDGETYTTYVCVQKTQVDYISKWEEISISDLPDDVQKMFLEKEDK